MFANHVYQMGRYHQLAILQTQSCPQNSYWVGILMQENGLGLVSYLLGFEAVFAWQSLCENQHFYKKKPHFSWFPANLGAEGLRIRNKTSPTNQSGKVGRWLLMFQSVDLFILFICWCWSLPNLVLGMLNSNQLRGHEFSSTIPPYPRSCAPEGYVQTRMPFILRLCNFDLTWNFGESELSTAPTAASPASRYKIPDIFGYVTEIYSFRLGLLRKRGLWWLMHTFDIWTGNDSRITLFANALVPCFGRTGIHQGTSD